MLNQKKNKLPWLNITPSKLEQWRHYRDGLFNGLITEKCLIDYLTSDFKPNEAVHFGTAFHLLLENGADAFPSYGAGGVIVSDKKLPRSYVFSKEEISKVNSWRSSVPGLIPEVPVVKFFEQGGYNIRLSMKIDGCLAYHLYEEKTTSRPPNYDKYLHSLQWRAYLLGMPAARKVCYDIWHFYQTNKDDPRSERKLDHYRYTFNRPKEIDLMYDISTAVDGLVNFCITNQILHVLRPAWLVKKEAQQYTAKDEFDSFDFKF